MREKKDRRMDVREVLLEKLQKIFSEYDLAIRGMEISSDFIADNFKITLDVRKEVFK